MNDQPAIIWGTRQITWQQMSAYEANAIGQLKTFGLKFGDRVAICAPTSPEYIIVVFTLWRMGVVVCPINPKLPSKAIADYLSQIHAVLLLTTFQFKSANPKLAQRILVLNEIVNFDARRGLSDQTQQWQPDLNQEVTVIATSGSSGQPKAVVHTWGNHYFNALGSVELIQITSGDRWLLCLPLFHVAGIAILVRVLVAKAAVIIPVEEDLLETITKRRPTHASFVSTQMFRLLSAPNGVSALKQMKYILLGGSSIPTTLIEESKEHHLNVYLSYGLTEMASQVATGKVGEGVKVLNHRELKIADNGHVFVKGKTLCKGYIKAGRVRLPVDKEGWFDTADLGHIDDKGCLTIQGRADNMFISGGENIHPEEIEKVLLSIKGIEQALVVPRADVEFGFRPVAFIDYAKDAQVRIEVIIPFLQEHLPSFKIPSTFYPWPQDLIEKGIKISRKDMQLRLSR